MVDTTAIMFTKLPHDRWTGLIILLLAGAGAVACARGHAQHASNRTGGVVIQNIGSDTMVNVAQAWAEVYAEVSPNVSVEVSGGGSGTGVAALINGTADIANCSRELEPEEIARVVAASGREPQRFVVGYDALAIFVHRDHPLDEISLEDLAAIYSEHGNVRRWSDLGVQPRGCTGGRMILISRQSNSGTYHYFREAILGRGVDFRLGTLDLHGSKDVVELIGRTPCAIGYSGMGYATPHVKMLRVVRRSGEPGIAPSVETAQSGEYPIARPLLIFTRGEPSREVREYLDWIHTDAGQRIVMTSGYVPLGAGVEPSQSQIAAERR